MKRLWPKIRVVILTATALLSVLFAPLFASGTPQRGQAPECQEECLKKHTENMQKLAEEYKATGNRLQYQDNVQLQGLQYEACIKSCRQFYPVK